MGKGTALSPDLFSDRAAEAGNMVTERHQKQPQMRGIGSNEAVSRIDTSLSIGPRTLLNDCNHSATAIFWRSAII